MIYPIREGKQTRQSTIDPTNLNLRTANYVYLFCYIYCVRIVLHTESIHWSYY